MFHYVAAGIEVGYGNIKIVLGKRAKDCFFIKDYRIFDTPDGTFSYNDTLNISIVLPYVERAVKELKCKKMDCYITLSSSKAVVRERELPKVGPVEMENLVKYEAEQLLSCSADDFVIDYRVIGEETNKEKDIFRTLIVAVPREIILSYMQFIKELNLKLKGINVYSNCMYKYASQYILENDNNILLVDIGSKYSKMTIIKEREYFASINSKIGGKDATVSISQLMAYSLKKAEEEKIRYGKIQYSLDLSKMIKTDYELNACLMSTYSEIADEIMRVVDFFRTRRYGAKINKVILLGGAANLKDINQFLKNILGVHVMCLDVPKDISNQSEINLSQDQYRMLVPAIGAILKGS